MSTKKIVLPSNRKPGRWIVNDLVRCGMCNRSWTAVYPAGTDETKLECPRCGAFESITEGKTQ